MAENRPKPRSHQHRLRRKIWFLWAPAFSLLAFHAITVYFLNLRITYRLDRTSEPVFWLEEVYYPAALLGLFVLLFIVYTIWKQIELHGLQEALDREAADRESARARLNEIVDLFQLAAKLNVPVSIDRLLEIIVRRTVGCLRAQQASIMLYSPEEELLRTRASYGVEGEFASDACQKPGEGIAGWVFKNRKSLLLNQGDEHPVLKSNAKRHRHITSAISVPVLFESRCIGVLNVNRIAHPEPLTEPQLEIVQLFAEHVGGVIERAVRMEELGSRTRSLEKTNAELLEFNRMKDLFLSTASHELKTPLTSVIGYAELLSDHYAQLGRDKQQEFLGRMRSESERLMRLIEDIMDLSRLQTGKSRLHPQALPVNDVVHSAVETVQGMADKHRVTLLEELDADTGDALVDEVKIRQVIVNLLTNAVRFSPEKGSIMIRTSRVEDGIRVSVADQGPGIPAEDQDRIFNLFGQGANREGKEGGLGIGLHLVKRIVELHGGCVGLESRPGRGSNFWFRLPPAGTVAVPVLPDHETGGADRAA